MKTVSGLFLKKKTLNEGCTDVSRSYECVVSFCLGCGVEWVFNNWYDVILAWCLHPRIVNLHWDKKRGCIVLLITDEEEDGCDGAHWVVYFYRVQDGICINIKKIILSLENVRA